MRQSVQKAKFSALCKFALCKCLSSLSDLKKIPHYANFLKIFLIFRTMQDYIRTLQKAALCKSALSKSALNKDLLYIHIIIMCLLRITASSFKMMYPYVHTKRISLDCFVEMRWKKCLGFSFAPSENHLSSKFLVILKFKVWNQNISNHINILSTK